jgi:hypothetical protein
MMNFLDEKLSLPCFRSFASFLSFRISSFCREQCHIIPHTEHFLCFEVRHIPFHTFSFSFFLFFVVWIIEWKFLDAIWIGVVRRAQPGGGKWKGFIGRSYMPVCSFYIPPFSWDICNSAVDKLNQVIGVLVHVWEDARADSVHGA